MKRQSTKGIVTIMLMLFSVVILSGHAIASENISINKTNIKLYVSGTYTLKIAGTDNVTWSAKDKTIAAVTKSGKVTANKPGTTVIIAKVNNQEFSCEVTVKKFTKSEAVKLVKNYIKAHDNYGMPRFIEVDHIKNDDYIVHAYDVSIFNDVTTAATYNFYHVNKKNGKIKPEY